MTVRTVYQTLEDRDNPDEVEQNGPFVCRRKGAWLGEGHYFWESFIQNAHWWGEECNDYLYGYVICSAYYDLDDINCFNLVDNPEHINLFIKAIELMREKNLFSTNTTVSRVINFLKNDLKFFKYHATRVYGVNSKKRESAYHVFLNFKAGDYQYLDLRPAIQICFYEKNSLNLRNYKIVYPDKYIDDILV
jgi:hypothetical protein